MQRDIRAVIDGAIGGFAGTVTMSAVMLAAGKLGLMGEQPPELIVGAALDSAGLDGQKDETRDALSVAAHFGFGVAAGALFGLLRRRLRLPIGPAVAGVVFGTLVWAASYAGVLPALGVMPSPGHDRPGRPAAMLTAHWVFGWTLGKVVGLRPSRRLGA